MKEERQFDRRQGNDCWLEKRNWPIEVLMGESESMKQIVGFKKMGGQLLTQKKVSESKE